MSLIKRPPVMKMAPPGYHVVETHVRFSSLGLKYIVKAHVRKNRGQILKLLPENVLYLYWTTDHNFPRLGAVKGFKEYAEIDNVIQFWIEYWKNAGLPFPEGMDPFLIKVIIAAESSFKADAKVSGSTATGLMQLLSSTLQRLSGKPDSGNIEVKDFYLDLTSEDLKDPVVNIAAGIRWFSHKYQLMLKNKKIKDKSVWGAVKFYHANDIRGEQYAEKIKNLYDSSR